MAVEHPAKIDSLIDLACESYNFPIVAKTLARGENARKQECGVDGGDFTVPSPFAGFRIHPVVKPTALLKRASIKESQCVTRALERLGFLDPFSFCRNTDCREAEPCGGNARDVLVTWRQGRTVHARAIRHETCLGIGLFPEVTKGAFLKISDERFVLSCLAVGERDETERDDRKLEWANDPRHFNLRLQT